MSLDKTPYDIALCIADLLDQEKDLVSFLQTTRCLYLALTRYTTWRCRQSIFQYAVKHSRQDLLERVFHMPLDINEKIYPDFRSPIYLALVNGDQKIVELLLSNPDLKIDRSESLLGAVWSAGHLSLFDILVEDERLDLRYYWRSQFRGQDPFFIRWMKDMSMERLTRLWHHRSRITASVEDLPEYLSPYIPSDSDWNNALHIAVARGHEAWTQYLFEEFPDMAQEYNQKMEMPINMVIAKKDLAIIDFLLQTNPSIFLTPTFLSDPPLFEILHNEDLSLFQRVHSVLGESVFTLQDLSGNVPIITAATRGYNAMVIGLIRLGADPNATDTDGCTPLMLATRNNNLSLFKSLLRFRKRVDLDREDSLGWTTFIWARWPQYSHRGQTSEEHAEIRRALEARGAGKGALGRVEKNRWPKKMWLSRSVRKSLI